MVVDSELTAAEKRLLLAFQRQRGDGARVREYEYTPAVLAELTGTNEDAVMQAAFTLAKKGLCVVKSRDGFIIV